MKRTDRHRLVAATAALALSGFAGLATANVLPQNPPVDRVGSRAYLPSAEAKMAVAAAAAPYDIRQPTFVPSGMKLDFVESTPGDGPDPSVVSVDLFYSDGTGNQIHIWETNIPDFSGQSFDPAAPNVGTARTIAGKEWRAESRHGLIILSTRFADGVTVSADTNLSEAALIRVLGTLK